jgi:hypothetical protein
MEQIHEMGHEIGFHYEVLDKVKGDYKAAIILFKNELEQFPYNIETICMHGNPLTPWDNRDLWSHYDFKQFGILGEAYLSLDFSNIEYFSDTGRTWNNRYSIKDVTLTGRINNDTFLGTRALMEYIRHVSRPVCIVTHPQRWNDSYKSWIYEFISQSIKNMGKSGIKRMREKR